MPEPGQLPDQEFSINQLIDALRTLIRLQIGQTPSEWTVRCLEREIQARAFADFADRGRGSDDLHIPFLRPSPMPHASSNFLSATQAARLLDISTETLRALRRVGRGPDYSMRLVRKFSAIYSRHDLEAWVEGSYRRK